MTLLETTADVVLEEMDYVHIACCSDSKKTICGVRDMGEIVDDIEVTCRDCAQMEVSRKCAVRGVCFGDPVDKELN